MARPPKTKGAPFYYTRGMHIPEEQKNELLELLGIDTDDDEERDFEREFALFYELEMRLGSYDELVKSTDNAPTPASYRAELEELRKLAWAFSEALSNTSYWMDECLTSADIKRYDLLTCLAGFIEKSGAKLTQLEEAESRGRPPKKAVTILVNSLHILFENFYVTLPDETDLDEKDATDKRKMNGKERAEIDFITRCFEIAQITPPSNCRSLIYDENTPENEQLHFVRS